jgi:hypothetical protein
LRWHELHILYHLSGFAFLYLENRMSDSYLILLIYLFLAYSFGLLSMGYLAGHEDLVEKLKSSAKKKKQIQRNQEEWLDQIRRN